MYRIGVDVGGTFTDFVVFNNETGDSSYFKVPSYASPMYIRLPRIR